MQVGGHDSGRQAVKLRAKMAQGVLAPAGAESSGPTPGATAVQGDGITALRFDGVIDEHNGLAQIGDALAKGDTLVVDLGGVKRLNSVGVRDWVNWLRAMRIKFRTVVIYDCPASVMNEVNFVKNFAEGAYITTFVAPLFCLRCQKEEARILETHRIRNGQKLMIPAFNCERSDCENALDDDEESYFGFVRTLPDGIADERLMRVTAQARALLASAAATPVAEQAKALDARDGASAGRGQQLGQLGLQGMPRASSDSVPNPQAMASASSSPAAPEVRGDWLFIAAMAAMLAVLGVLIYLILTLE